MSMATALSLCPETIRRPGNFSCYRDVSRKVMNIFSEFTTLVEPVSLDGACMDHRLFAMWQVCYSRPSNRIGTEPAFLRQVFAFLKSNSVAYRS